MLQINYLIIFTKLFEFAYKMVIIYVLTKIALYISNKMVSEFFDKRIVKLDDANEIRRNNTIREIVNTFLKYVILFQAFILVLQLFNIDPKTIIATAGIGGIAISFGSQSLVKDVITGFFLFIENQFSLGEHVKINGFEGEVKEIKMRTTTLLGKDSEIVILPNSSISTVVNYSRMKEVKENLNNENTDAN